MSKKFFEITVEYIGSVDFVIEARDIDHANLKAREIFYRDYDSGSDVSDVSITPLKRVPDKEELTK